MATTFTNQATLSYNGSTVQSNVAVGVIESSLSVTKQAVNNDYRAGDTVTYIVSIVNSGDAAFTGLELNDNLGAYGFGENTLRPLSYIDSSIQYYLDGVQQPEPTVTVTEADGLTVSGINVPANGSTMLIYSAEVNEFAPLDLGSSITNVVEITGNNACEAEAEETVPVANTAVLALVKSVTPIPVAENGELTYTFQMQNSGNTAVTAEDNAVITDTFMPILKDLSVSMNGNPMTAGADYTYDEATGVFSTAQGALTIPAAEFSQDPATGEQLMSMGTATLVITGTISSACEGNQAE